MTRSSGFAELSGDRMITDIGPSCEGCDSPTGQGMWLYLIPTESDWEIGIKCRDGRAVAQAQCACCHRVECFDVREAQCDNVQRLRATHACARDKVGGIFSVVAMCLRVAS